MGNNNVKTTNDVLIKVDQNNLVYIDPNTVLSNGVVQPRDVEPENLVMYVNLEADLVPRSVLINNENNSTLTSVASGTLNFMKNADGRDYDTNWSESFTTLKQNNLWIPNAKGDGGMSIPIGMSQYDETGQSFGITDINIEVKGTNFIPKVTIKFVDVRGKTLFESPPNSPYAAFFHLPWPIFYLTVKGYYGKAIRYRLHMIKFNSKYNPANGNFEIQTDFVGSTYAYLADISMECVMNAPYFYPSESRVTTEYNEETKTYNRVVKKTTKGFRVLRSVYQEYINKGLLPSDFPVRTLREIIKIAGKLNSMLEKKIFSEIINHKVLAGVKSFSETLTSLERGVYFWTSKYLSPTSSFHKDTTRQDPITGISNKIAYRTLSSAEKNSIESISGSTKNGTLENILSEHVKKLESNQAFGVNREKNIGQTDKIKTDVVSCTSLKNINDFWTRKEGKVGVDVDLLTDRIELIKRDFDEKAKKLQNQIELEMNTFVKQKEFGIGFEPSVRNIIGVLLANAETYVRLMKDVHEKAFDRANDRKTILSEVLTDSKFSGDAIYPWPEIKEKISGGKELVLMYPGSEQMVGKLQADDKLLWPEVEFVENFYDIAIKKSDNLSDDENADKIEYLFDNSIGRNRKDLSVLTNVINFVPYTDKALSSILYELYERGKYTTSLSPFTDNAIRELANVEYDNLKEQVLDDEDIVKTLKRNVKNYSELLDQMETIITKYPYYEDQLPTVEYIRDGLLQDFKIERYTESTETSTGNNNDYIKVSEFLNNYKAEEYRRKLYPFNSTTYQSYLNQDQDNILKSSNLKLNRLLHVDAPQNFISSLRFPSMWVKDNFINNLFTNTIKIDGIDKHILNTPYFHKQLYTDFTTSQVYGKYVGSAYLLLNSLPFKDLDDQINNTSIQAFNQATLGFSLVDGDSTLVSSIFRELAATHYIPYHMMLKWGSIYHRYKKFITEGVDIIADVTDAIDGGLFFDNNEGLTYNTIPDVITGATKTVTRSNQSDIGLYPYYNNIFYQIITGLGFYNTGSAVSSYSEMIASGVTQLHYQETNNGNLWTSIIDDSKFDPTLLYISQLENLSREQADALVERYTYTLLPSNGNNVEQINSFLDSEQENLRILWDIGTAPSSYINYSGQSFPSYAQYFASSGSTKEYSLTTNYRKVIDLIATFKPDILEAFESAFIDFASEKLAGDVSYNYYNMKYNKFQDLLKKMVTIRKDANDQFETLENISSSEIISKIKSRQSTTLSDLTTEILSNDNLIKLTLANPREIDDYVIGGFTNVDVKHFSVNPFDMSGLIANQDKIELYLGEDMDLYYNDFFITNDIEVTEENILQFRPLIYMFAGKRASDGGAPITKTDFVKYVKDTVVDPPIMSLGNNYVVNGPSERLKIYLDQLIGKIQSTNFDVESDIEESYIKRGYYDDPIKLETYNYFKSFNDKWTAGNSIGQRTLMEEFLFLDKANKDIGSVVFLNMEKLLRLEHEQNSKINLYSAISLLIQDTGFDIRALPAYINFYGNTYSNTNRITPSKNVAQSIFGTFLDIDYQDASPKIILQYVGPTSKHLNLFDVNKKYMFKDDGFDIGNVNNNPILIAPDVFTSTDLTKSNKCVAFEVSFGDQNQSIFKSVELDQSTIKNTSESFIVYEKLGLSEGGGSTAQVDVGLFDIYRQASYQCTVTCMGDVMIQPTMYFYLKNIPLFQGSYWITEVSHNISPRGIETKFKGTRIPQQSLPKPEDSFMASYRSLFDTIIQRADTKLKEEEAEAAKAGKEQTIIKPDGTTVKVKSSNIDIPNEKKLTDVGYTPYGIPYNGANDSYDTDIRLVEYNGTQWLRATALGIGGKTYKGPDPTTDMTIVTRVSGKTTWAELSKENATQDFYFSKFLQSDKYLSLTTNYKTTEFLNPTPRERIYRTYTTTVTTNINKSTNTYQGPVHQGPYLDGDPGSGTADIGYGIALSKSLMNKLHLWDGDVVYFKLY